MNVLVVDDDPIVRSAVRGLVEARGGQVLAEADTALTAIDVAERFGPDVLVLDLALAAGDGLEVVRRLRESLPTTVLIVFSAYVDAAQPFAGQRVRIVEKPAFDRLDAALGAVVDEDRGADADRRRAPRRAAAVDPSRRDDPAAFYEALANAHPGDAVLAIPTGEADPRELAGKARRAVRDTDVVTIRRDLIVLLLVEAGRDGTQAVLDRLGPVGARACIVAEPFDPFAVLAALSTPAPVDGAILTA